MLGVHPIDTLRRARWLATLMAVACAAACTGDPVVGGPRLDAEAGVDAAEDVAVTADVGADAPRELMCGAGLRAWWFHWFLGDAPAGVRLALRRLGVADGRTQPQCHGLAQGLLGWLLEREAAKCSLASAEVPSKGGELL